ncbi:MAG: ABC-type multidrug transport system ATPase subunit [Saprospiraceae bacterium]
MKISLDNIGKQFNGEWIFKSVSLSFSHEFCYLITGHNGSGKSSLLKVLCGYSVPSQGIISWIDEAKAITEDQIHKEVSVCAPFVELFGGHSVTEAIEFHFKFKKLTASMSIEKVIDFCYLDGCESKLISELSSGMKQRLKLALNFLSETPYVFLDEPCSNLDERAIKWYQENLVKYKKDRLVIICSNNKEEEHFLCDKTVNLGDYKKQ